MGKPASREISCLEWREENIKSKRFLSRFTASIAHTASLSGALMCLTSFFPLTQPASEALLLYVFCSIKRYKHHSVFCWLFSFFFPSHPPRIFLFIALTFLRHSPASSAAAGKRTNERYIRDYHLNAHLSNQWRLNFSVLILAALWLFTFLHRHNHHQLACSRFTSPFRVALSFFYFRFDFFFLFIYFLFVSSWQHVKLQQPQLAMSADISDFFVFSPSTLSAFLLFFAFN
jgi:hypothetical protein